MYYNVNTFLNKWVNFHFLHSKIFPYRKIQLFASLSPTIPGGWSHSRPSGYISSVSFQRSSFSHRLHFQNESSTFIEPSWSGWVIPGQQPQNRKNSASLLGHSTTHDSVLKRMWSVKFPASSGHKFTLLPFCGPGGCRTRSSLLQGLVLDQQPCSTDSPGANTNMKCIGLGHSKIFWSSVTISEAS